MLILHFSLIWLALISISFSFPLKFLNEDFLLNESNTTLDDFPLLPSFTLLFNLAFKGNTSEILSTLNGIHPSPESCAFLLILQLGMESVYQIGDLVALHCQYPPQFHLFLEDKFVWLAARELNFVLQHHGNTVLIEYAQFISAQRNPLQSHDILEFEWIFHLKEYSQSYDLPNSFTKDIVQMHCMLNVYWDELGNPLAAYEQHRLCIQLLIIIYPFEDIRNFLSLTKRSLLNTDAIIESYASLTIRRQYQLHALHRLLNDTHNFIPNYKFCSMLSQYDLSFSTTPPSMMIGYQPHVTDRELFELSNQFYNQFLRPIPPFTFVSKKNSSIVQIGFISCYFFDHSISRLINQVIQELNNDKNFEITVIALTTCTAFIQDTEYIKLQRAIRNFRTIPNQQIPDQWSYHFIEKSITFIRSLNLDVVIFPELGMDTLTLKLSQHRLAPIQIIFWGHPLPQYSSHLDYFISSELFEPFQRIPSHNEQLLLMESLTYLFNPPDIRSLQIMEDSMNNTNNSHFYLFPHTIMKYSPGK